MRAAWAFALSPAPGISRRDSSCLLRGLSIFAESGGRGDQMGSEYGSGEVIRSRSMSSSSRLVS